MSNRSKQEILAALAAAADDFAGAKYGEDVRAAMIAIDDAVYEAIDNQAVVVDAQLSSTGFAADAKVVGDRFVKTPWYKGTLTAGTSENPTSTCIFTIVSWNGLQKFRGTAAINNGTISWSNESTDTDLEVANRPADAKAVGDALSNVQTDINFLTDMFDNVTWYKGVYTDSAPGYGDANNINTNSIYALNIGGYTYSHLPTGISGIAYIVTMTTGTTVCQIVYGSNGNIWTRRKISDVWGEWGGSIDSTLTVNHAAANASTVGNLLYGDSDHTNRTPASPIRYSGTLTSSLVELPVNAWIRMNGETLKELLGDDFTWAKLCMTVL